MTNRVDKDSLPLNQPRRTPSHPTKSHIVKTKVDGKEKIIRFGEQGASTAGKPKEGESDRMKAKRASFKSRHAKNIAKGPSSPAYWANKVKWADGGFVKTNYYDGGSMRAQPQNAALGSIAEFLKQTYSPRRTQQMQGTMEFLGVPALARTAERLSYGQPITNVNKANVPLLPDDTAEAAMLVAPMAGPLGRVAKKTGVAGARMVGEELNRAILDNSGPLAKLVPQAAKPLYAVKPKGGNWQPPQGSRDSVTMSVNPIKRNPEVMSGDLINQAAGEDLWSKMVDLGPSAYNSPVPWLKENRPDVLEKLYGEDRLALNKWLDTKLEKYIRNEMGTPDDPIRLAHEQGYSHIPGDAAEELGAWLPDDVIKMRREAGYPEEGFAAKKHADAGYPEDMEANTRKAELWETIADMEITATPAREFQDRFRMAREMPNFVSNGKQEIAIAERNPWIEKLDPKTPIYKIDRPIDLNENLGFGHMADEIENMLDPDSGLPAALRLTPQQLDKVTMKQMVEKVDAVNKWRSEEAAKAELGDMMGNLTATPRMQIPDAQLSFVKEPGMTWIDIPATVDESAMKLCTTIGKQAGWCTQGEGLAKRYGSGDNRLTTLIDAEGRPHAQAMTANQSKNTVSEKEFEPYLQQAAEMARARFPANVDEDTIEAATRDYARILASEKRPKNITELKPVENAFSSDRAREYMKRDPQYKAKITDSVLKFLNADRWGDVNDLHHYDIVDLKDTSSKTNYLKYVFSDDVMGPVPKEYADKLRYALINNPDAPRFMSIPQFRDFVEPPPPPVKEQKMLQGFYRGYAGDYDATKAGTDAGMVFVSPQRGVGDIFANKRAAQTGADPHLEMILADPFAGYGYGMNVPLNKQNQKIDFTRARQLDPEDVKGRTQLYAEGGSVSYDPSRIEQIMSSISAPQNYAEGGSVSVYDSGRVDAIVNQFM